MRAHKDIFSNAKAGYYLGIARMTDGNSNQLLGSNGSGTNYYNVASELQYTDMKTYIIV